MFNRVDKLQRDCLLDCKQLFVIGEINEAKLSSDNNFYALLKYNSDSRFGIL